VRTIREEGMPKRVAISLRLSPPVYETLLATARTNGTSLTTEAEHCIRRGLDQSRDFGGARAYAFFSSLASEVAACYGDDWLRDPARFEPAREHIINRLRATRIIPPAEGAASLADIALDMFITTRDSRLLASARELVEYLPFELRAEALAKIAEVEADPEAFRPRRLRIRVPDDGRPLEKLPDSEGDDIAEPPLESGRE
jgi:hypothetical protein